jgi:hypothetical protein
MIMINVGYSQISVNLSLVLGAAAGDDACIPLLKFITLPPAEDNIISQSFT